MPKRLIWELFLLAAGVSYLGILLCDNVQCVAFAVVFVALAAEALVGRPWRERSAARQAGRRKGRV